MVYLDEQDRHSNQDCSIILDSILDWTKVAQQNITGIPIGQILCPLKSFTLDQSYYLPSRFSNFNE